MPITEPRPGVFHGRADNKWAWYVVDPAVGDPELVAAEWQSLFDKSNSSRASRFGLWGAGLLVFAGVIAATVALAGAASRWLGGGEGTAAALIIGAIGLVVSLVAVFVVVEKLFPRVLSITLRDDRAIQLDSEVVEWASPTTSSKELWVLQSAILEVDQVRAAWEYWEIFWDSDTLDKPRQLIDRVIRPVLEVEMNPRVATLNMTAERLNFAIPERLTRALDTRTADN